MPWKQPNDLQNATFARFCSEFTHESPIKHVRLGSSPRGPRRPLGSKPVVRYWRCHWLQRRRRQRCAATRVGGNAEIIDDGRTGRLVPVGDPRSLSVALAEMLDHPNETSKMGVAARKSVVERFSLDAMTLRFETFYEQLCDVRPTARSLV